MKSKTFSLACLILIALIPCSIMAYSGGSGTQVDPYQISTWQDIVDLSTTTSDWNKYYIQTSDISASTSHTVSYSPIGSASTKFTGSYNGFNHTIDDLYINQPDSRWLGLFGYCEGATIENLGLTNINITGEGYIGGLVGNTYNMCSISNCYTTGQVNGSYYLGGLIGVNQQLSTVTTCYSSVDVTGDSTYTGGLIGFHTASYSGMASTLSESYSTGNVVGDGMTGGLVGMSFSSHINDCYSSSSVNGVDYVGGLVGWNSANSLLETSFSYGDVTGSGSYIGGLIGYSHPTTSYTYDSFWDTQTSGVGTSDGGSGKTTAEMKSDVTFIDANWDFELETANGSNDYWDIDADGLINNGYPFLSWENGNEISRHNAFIYVSTTGNDSTSIGLQSSPFRYIQDAIDYSEDGDTILVLEGVYFENINFDDRKMVLGSLFMTTGDTSYISSTIIDGNNKGSVVSFISGEDSTSILCGFTIQNGKGTLVNTTQRFGGGIYCYASSRPTISNCIIKNNSADAGSGGGIACWYASAIIENCIIKYNTNHGISNAFGDGVKVVNSLIHNNYGTDYGGGINAGGGSIPVIINCTIADNDSYHQIGSGIHAVSGVQIINSIIWNNSGTDLDLYDPATDISYSCIDGGYDGTGNKEVEPNFVDPDNGNYILTDSSQCIGCGTSTNAPTIDLAGNLRPEPNGSAPDMGAYENSLSIPTGLKLEIRNLQVAAGQDPLHITDQIPVISFDFYNNAEGELSSYQMQISSFADFSDIDKWDTQVIISSDKSLVYNGNALEDGQTYYLRAKGHSIEIWDLWSDWDTISFRMNSLPLAPDLLSPIDDVVLSDNFTLMIHQSSDPEADILEYEYFLYEDSSMVNAIDSSGIQTDTSWTIAVTLTDNDHYWWKARSFDGFEYGVFSDKGSFYVNTENSAPDSFNLVYPVAEGQVPTQSPTLIWHSAYEFDPGDTVTYTLFVDPPEAGIIQYDVSTDTLFQLTGLTDNMSYYWKVIASDQDGVTRENTEGYQSFTVNVVNENPSTPSILSPDSVIVLSLKPKFKWEASTDPDFGDTINYKIYVWNKTYRDSTESDSNVCMLTNPLTDNSEFSWCVKAMDNHSGYAWSPIVIFWTDLFPEPPAVFNTISPLDGEVFESTFVEFIWNNAKDPDPLDYATYTLKYKSVHQDSTTWHEVDVSTDTSMSLDLVLGNRYEWQVIAKDDDGFEVISDSSHLRTFDVGTVGIASGIPDECSLEQNYPNPFNPITAISYQLSVDSDIELLIFDMNGRKVATLVNDHISAGYYSINWNASHFSSGIYFYRMTAGNFIETKKMILMK